ncbi:unnamed protein product [Lasius platythorax]|uniref:RRM domain-containing protein n=2 Tax=Lasius platythorax TaxID=488582 RepID=A0AAV2NPW0_9HYME
MDSRVYNKKTMDNNLSNTDMMDYEKYYKQDSDGNYNLHFLNKNGLSINEIREIFSAYGKVLSVNVSGNDYGLRFIKYKTLDETECCIKGLANSNIIQLLLERTKMNGSNNRLDKKNSSQWQAARTENSSQRASTTGKQFNLNSAHNGKFSEIESLPHNVKTSNGDNQSDNADNFSDTGSKNSRHSYKSNVNASKYDKSDSLVSKPLPSRQQNSINNSSNKIDYEKYYKIGKDGAYILHFVNKKELDLEEIRKLFSPYGNVISVHANEDKINGLVFVRYKTLQETITCLEGLQNNDVICILPQKDKINGAAKRTDQRSSNQWQSAGMQNSFQGTFNTKPFNSSSNYDKEFSKAGEKSIHNTTSNGNNRFDNANNFLDTDRRNSNNDYKSVNATTHSDSLISNKQHLLPSRQQSINYEVSDYNQEQQQKNKSYSSTKPDTNTYVNKDISDDKIPALISDTEIKQNEFDAMSDSSLQAGTKNASSNVMIIPMQEIIVANIHSNYDVHYILHLFKKHNPISATLAETILGTNIRYCHIYFKTIQDSVAIEEEFDNFDLSGKNLIVLRISRLKEEATCK